MGSSHKIPRSFAPNFVGLWGIISDIVAAS